MDNRDVIEMLKRYVLLLNAEGFSVSKAYLYGSYAAGTATNESDIDVLIVSDKVDENDDKAIGKAWRLTRKVSTRIEPYIIGLKNFNSLSSSPLVDTVKEKGVLIV
jgi:predicted nucleotidyltransferase